MTELRAWFRSWMLYWRAIYKLRTKRHGVGAQPWRNCFCIGRHVRHIAYGQHKMFRTGKTPPLSHFYVEDRP